MVVDGTAIDAGIAALVGAELVVELGMASTASGASCSAEPSYIAGPAVTARTHRLVAGALGALGAPARAQAWHRLAAADDADVDEVADHVLDVMMKIVGLYPIALTVSYTPFMASWNAAADAGAAVVGTEASAASTAPSWGTGRTPLSRPGTASSVQAGSRSA